MELQASRDSPQLADNVPAEISTEGSQQQTRSLTQAKSRITEFAAESNLNSRCDVCSQNLRACVVAIEHAASTNSNILEKVRLRDLQKRLEVCLVVFMRKDHSRTALNETIASLLTILSPCLMNTRSLSMII